MNDPNYKMEMALNEPHVSEKAAASEPKSSKRKKSAKAAQKVPQFEPVEPEHDSGITNLNSFAYSANKSKVNISNRENTSRGQNPNRPTNVSEIMQRECFDALRGLRSSVAGRLQISSPGSVCHSIIVPLFAEQ
jgi:hypothetical protein